ncbi:peptidase T [Sporomusa acidovorans]|uniref:Peptidase T n=1 Tax=Sporomusa acidovorans (strain ATCC 49682 / DSM 3132 / Mol) TaxID=1123286 RepID=A0ABZ3J6L9_SPOA4|nr:peptidase T [Sporomusa acidovorans]OZC21031.1 peptidase T [Sporomusa acidovorans DSM 3132]SDF17904.1 peptidase T. Metallo peptidase. MEROPS family M20B [Sporomusa acidovorans]
MREAVLNRFLRYVRVDTRSELGSDTYPSTLKQLNLAKMLRDELLELGVPQVELDQNGYIIAKIPGNFATNAPAIGFLAHYDTSPDLSGENVCPKIVENYDGKDIALDEAGNYILSPAEFPELVDYQGQTLITTDGTTLLGADDKAGIAEIITAIEYFLQHPEIKHGPLCIGFTPDEEVSGGTKYFDIARFGAELAYTIDGEGLGSINFENFNAASATIVIKGCNIHPGSAKHKMINASLLGIEFNEMLPLFDRPMFTDSYEGFYHLTDFRGNVEEAVLNYLIREHDRKIFEQRKVIVQQAVNFLKLKYPKTKIDCEITDSYYNMREKIEPVAHIIAIAEQAMRDIGVTPVIFPIRGGTDGARLSFNGLPCPNLFTGGHNAHGRYEYIPLESMEKAVQTIVRLIELFATPQNALK